MKPASFLLSAIVCTSTITTAVEATIEIYEVEDQYGNRMMELCNFGNSRMISSTTTNMQHVSPILCISNEVEYLNEGPYDEEAGYYDQQLEEEEEYDWLYAPNDDELQYNFRTMNKNLQYILTKAFPDGYSRPTQEKEEVQQPPTTISDSENIYHKFYEAKEYNTLETVVVYSFNGVILLISWMKYMALFDMAGLCHDYA